jgi:hypothetical protein
VVLIDEGKRPVWMVAAVAASILVKVREPAAHPVAVCPAARLSRCPSVWGLRRAARVVGAIPFTTT